MRRKVYVIGIDGATFKVIDPLVAQGKLPTFGYIIEHGVHGTLRSTLPANSAVAWSSFMTGKNAGKHGVFGFITHAPERDQFVLTNGAHVKSKTLWEIVSEAGRTVAVINVPLTYPPRPVRGLLVSGMDASSLKDFTYPPEFARELMEISPRYRIDLPFIQHHRFQEVLRRQVAELVDARRQAMLYMLDKTDPHLFVGVFTCTDRIQHHFWHGLDATHPRHDAGDGTIITETYRQIDQALGGFLERMGKEDTLVVISDHGFCGTTRRFMVNQWLCQQGWLCPTERPRASSWSRILRAAKSSPRLYAWAKRLKSAAPVLDRLTVREKAINRSLGDKIQWPATRAFYFPPGVRLNLKGREPYGIVSSSEYEPLREEIMRRLLEVRDELGHPVLERVCRREDVYQGPQKDLAPDIVLEPCLSNADAGRNFSLGRRMRVQESGQLFVDTGPSGEHSPDGILLAMGPGLKRGAVVEGAEISDIAPTALYLLDLPIPGGMDGKVLLNMMDPGFAHRAAPRFSGESTDSTVPGWEYGEGEEAVVRERLRDLGYLS